jgi:hypothetical protein
METLGAIAVVLLVLACPLSMLAIGGAVWLVGRVRGEKKDFSAGCMPMSGHGDKQASQSGDTALWEEVSRLQREVESFKAQSAATSGEGQFSATAGANGRKASEEATHPTEHA